ncbi:MAG: hypothetical protein WA485_16105 [Candidatus Sulfotelmatobacter sp.]
MASIAGIVGCSSAFETVMAQASYFCFGRESIFGATATVRLALCRRHPFQWIVGIALIAAHAIE